MYNYLYFILLLGMAASLTAQNESQFTHFAFNRLPFNAGFTGSDEALKITGLYRHQWDGVEGAPRTVFASAQTPLANTRSGLGISAMTEEIGFTSQSNVALNYAYHIPINRRLTLSVGISSALQFSNIDWAKGQPVDLQDGRIGTDSDRTTSPNFGAGAVLRNDRVFVGVSIPRFFKDPLYSNIAGTYQDQVEYHQLGYLMTGVNLPLSETISLQPTALVSYQKNAPLDLDLNAMIYFSKIFGVGASYRLDDSFDFLVQVKAAQRLLIGCSYDHTISDLSKASNGSYELMASYLFTNEKENILKCRFF